MKIKIILRTNIIYKNGKSPLMLRFIHARTSKQLSLGLAVEPRYWDKKAEMLTSDRPERAVLQSQIDGILAGYRKKIQQLEAFRHVDYLVTIITTKSDNIVTRNYFSRHTHIGKTANIPYSNPYSISKTPCFKSFFF